MQSEITKEKDDKIEEKIEDKNDENTTWKSFLEFDENSQLYYSKYTLLFYYFNQDDQDSYFAYHYR